MYKWRRKKSITILGSCCSRDILEYLPTDSLDISLYVARTKIVSQLSFPLVLDRELQLSSSFQKRLVLNDLQKGQWDALHRASGAFCLIDFIDERFNLIKIGIGGGNSIDKTTYITKSNELVNSGFLIGKHYEEMQYTFIDSKWLIDGQELDRYLEDWLKQVLNHYTARKIILHKSYLLNTYIDNSGQMQTFKKPYLINNEKTNTILQYLYDYTEYYLNKNHINKVKTIDLCRKYHAAENHKWGLAPMHYQSAYYEEAAELIKKYMKL